MGEHCRDTLRGLTNDISELDLSESERAWEVAVKWACRNLRSIREGTIQRASAEVRALLEAQVRQQGQQPGSPNAEMEATTQGERVAEDAIRERL